MFSKWLLDMYTHVLVGIHSLGSVLAYVLPIAYTYNTTGGMYRQ